MDDDDKSLRNQREAASWQSSTLTIPAIILAVILLMVGSTVMSKMAPPAASPAPTAAPASPAPDAAATREMNEKREQMQKMNDPAFVKKYQEESKKLKGDFSKLPPAEQAEVNSATQGHGKQFFEMISRR